jgi:hypothetical protein
VLAVVLNTSLSTVQKGEVGDKQPSGPSLKLLNGRLEKRWIRHSGEHWSPVNEPNTAFRRCGQCFEVPQPD